MVSPTGLVVLTDRRLAAGPLVEVVEAAVRGGAGWVILRERDLRYAERRALADALRALLPPGHLIVAGPDPLGGDAVHLAAGDPAPDSLRIVGRSCHDAGEVWRLVREDYVTLSPVYPTATKPGYGPPLTARGAARVAGGVPWLALGGVDSPERAAECAAAGAAGVAVLGAVMRAGDPAAATRELAEAFAAGRGQAVEAIPLAASASASAPAPAPATALARAIPIGAQSKAPGGGPAVGFAGGATGPGGRGWEAEVTGGGA